MRHCVPDNHFEHVEGAGSGTPGRVYILEFLKAAILQDVMRLAQGILGHRALRRRDEARIRRHVWILGLIKQRHVFCAICDAPESGC